MKETAPSLYAILDDVLEIHEPPSEKGNEDQSADQQRCYHWFLYSYSVWSSESLYESCAVFSIHSSVQRRCQ